MFFHSANLRKKIRGQFWINFCGSEIWEDSICFQPNFDQVFFKLLSFYILNLVCSSFLNLPQYKFENASRLYGHPISQVFVILQIFCNYWFDSQNTEKSGFSGKSIKFTKFKFNRNSLLLGIKP